MKNLPKKNNSKKLNKISSGMDIAIVGYSCRFPKSEDAEQFWGNLINGVDCVSEVPKNKWDVNSLYSEDINAEDKSYCRWMGALDKIDMFDAKFFNISPKEAKSMDPQQRLLLQEAWHCVESSGISLEELQQMKTGVYIGSVALDYYQTDKIDSHTGTGVYQFMLANRVSYFLGLKGNSITLDTGCSSAFIALNSACQSLLDRSCDYALVGGVNLHLSPRKYFMWSKGRMLSPTGKCHTFDKDADGYVSGEGVGMILLKPLFKAIADQDNICAVIKGCAVNHGGKGVSLTAPNVQAQKQLIEEAYRQAGFTPETVTYVEAHGTGTSLGDPIEVEALKQVFQPYSSRKYYCKLGSVKTNVGHLESCSAMAGLIKVLLMMKHKKIPQTLHLSQVNPIIDIENSVFEFASEKSDWVKIADDIPRRAGISSFGLGGANAHVIIEEYVEEKHEAREKGDSLLILSAKTPVSLKKMIEAWRKFILTEDYKKLSLRQIEDGLLAGRQHFRYRYGFSINEKAQIEKNLFKGNGFQYKKAESQYFIIPEHEYKGLISIDENLKSTDLFRNKLKDLKNQLELISDGKSLWNGFQQDKWDKTKGLFYTNLLDYVLYSILFELGVEPGFLCGEGNALISILLLTKVISFEEAMLWHQKRNIGKDYVFHHPLIPFYDLAEEQIIYPRVITKDYLEVLISQIIMPGDILNKYVMKARILYCHQHTFKHYMDEWSQYLNDDIEDILEGLSFEDGSMQLLKDEALLLMLIIKSSMEKVYVKWKLHDELDVKNEYFTELIYLIIDDIITKHQITEVILKDSTASINEVVEAVNIQIQDKKTSYHYPLLSRSQANEISSMTSWLKKAMEVKLSEEIKEKGLFFFWCDKKGEPKPYKEILLFLWLQGKSVNWHEITYRNSYRKCKLPGYVFDEQSYWLSQTDKYSLSKLEAKQKEDKDFSFQFNGDEFFFTDHVIKERHILPGSAYLDMAIKAYLSRKDGKIKSISNIMWKRAFMPTYPLAKIYASYSDEGGNDVACNIWGYGKDQKKVIYASTTFLVSDSHTETESNNAISLGEVRSRCNVVLYKDEFYENMKGRGYGYKDAFRTVSKIISGNGECLADLSLAESLRKNSAEYILHPAIIDGALQTALWCAYAKIENTNPRIPFAVQNINIYNSLSPDVTVHAFMDGADRLCADIYNLDGSLCIKIEEISLREYKDRNQAEGYSYIFTPAWKESGLAVEKMVSQGSILVIYQDMLKEIQKAFSERYHERKIIFIEANNELTESLNMLESQEFGEVYYLAGLRVWSDTEITVDSLEKTQEMGVLGLFRVISYLQRSGHGNKKLILKVAASNAIKVWEDDLSNPEYAAIYGLTMSIKKENYAWQVDAIDFDMSKTENISDNLSILLE